MLSLALPPFQVLVHGRSTTTPIAAWQGTQREGQKRSTAATTTKKAHATVCGTARLL